MIATYVASYKCSTTSRWLLAGQARRIGRHGTYHRGQVAARLRAAGDEPVNTDFITFARQRRLPVSA